MEITQINKEIDDLYKDIKTKLYRIENSGNASLNMLVEQNEILSSTNDQIIQLEKKIKKSYWLSIKMRGLIYWLYKKISLGSLMFTQHLLKLYSVPPKSSKTTETLVNQPDNSPSQILLITDKVDEMINRGPVASCSYSTTPFNGPDDEKDLDEIYKLVKIIQQTTNNIENELNLNNINNINNCDDKIISCAKETNKNIIKIQNN